MRRLLHTLLLTTAACSLEHPISRLDASDLDDATADITDVTRPDVVDASDVIDASDVVDANDVVDASDVADVPTDVGMDVPAPQDVVDAPPMTDAPDASVPADAPMGDVMDVPAPQDVVDAPPATDVVDVPVTPDVPAPTFIQVPTDTQTTARQGNLNGVGPGPALRCLPGEALVGFAYVHGQYVDALASRCAQLRANGTLGAIRQSVSWGGVLGDRHTDDCPAGSVAVGLTGRAERVVNQLAIQCAPLAAWIPGRMVTATTPARGGSGGNAFTSQCPAGYVGFGVDLESVAYDWGISATRLSLVCVRVNRQM